MPKWTKRDITKLKKLWKQGKKLSVIAESLDRTVGSTGVKVNSFQKKGELNYRQKGKEKKVAVRATKKIQKENPYSNPTLEYLGYLKEKKTPVRKSTQDKIEMECNAIKEFLLAKNEAYGDSAITPIRIFSKSDAQEQIKVRIDDKLNRLMQGKNTLEADEDVVKDLIGYLVLLLIQMKQ